MHTAFIIGSLSISYSGIMIFLAALCTVCMLLSLRSAAGRPSRPALLLSVITIIFALPLSRLIHWYSNAMQYPSFGAAMTDWSQGGFAVLGVFLAAFAALALLCRLGLVDNVAAFLDDMAVSGSLGLTVGRMACLFSTVNRSKFTLENELFHRFPLMVSAELPSGGTEWRIATFALESLSCLLIFLLLRALYGTLRGRERAWEEWRDGNVFLLFLSLYGAFTVLLDSTRYDPLYMRSNGFISITQLFCVVALLIPFVLLSWRVVKVTGLRRCYLAVWFLYVLGAGVAGYMEYFVQRRSHLFLVAYPVMALGLGLMVAMILFMLRATRFSGQKTPQSRRRRPVRYAGAHAK